MEITNFQAYIIFQHNNYVETVICEHNNVRVVDCSELDNTKLYRVEYGDTFHSHTVVYTLSEALQVFTKRSTDKFSLNYQQYIIIYRTHDNDVIVTSEKIESEYTPVRHARHEIQILANKYQKDMRYAIFNYNGKQVFSSTAIFEPVTNSNQEGNN